MHAAIRPLLLVAMLLVARGAARAEDPAPPKRLTPSQKAAVEALKAYEAEDRAAFERLARAPGTSAWQVADALRVQGHPEAARALAEASVDEDKPALLAYLEAEKALPRDDKALSAVDQANAAFGRNDFAGALQALEGVTGRGVPGIGVLNGRALALRNLGRLKDAWTTFVAMADAALALKWRAAAARALANACDTASELRDAPTLRDLLQRSLDLAKSRGRGSEVVLFTIDLGTATEQAGDRAGAEALLREGIRLARDAGAKQFLANGLTNLGHLLLDLGRLDESEPLLLEGLTLHESLKNAAYAERARMGLAEVRHLRGDFDGAIDLYRRTAEAQAKAGDRPAMAATLGRLARIHLERGALDDSLASATRAKEVADEVASPPAIVDALLGLARALRAKGRPVDAEARIQEALVLSQRVRYLSGDRWARLELAKSALAISDIGSAMEHGEAAITVAEREGDASLKIAAWAVVGCAAGYAGDTRRAEALLRDALAGLERGGRSPTGRAPWPTWASS